MEDQYGNTVDMFSMPIQWDGTKFFMYTNRGIDIGNWTVTITVESGLLVTTQSLAHEQELEVNFIVTAPLVPDSDEIAQEEEDMWDDISSGFDDWLDDWFDDDSWFDDGYTSDRDFDLSISMQSDWFMLDNTEEVALAFNI